MTGKNHLETDQLAGFLDGELTDAEFVRVRSHLALCAACRQRRDELVDLSLRVEALAATAPISSTLASKRRLAESLSSAKPAASNIRSSEASKYLRWGMAIAAMLAFGLLLVPVMKTPVPSGAITVSAVQAAPIQINGEDFVALPYSNPDLPMMTPRIVEMQVPVSSLAAAGILAEPEVNGSLDRTVRANVLLGMDGQPLGVHVLSSD